MAEFALVSPILLWLVFAIIDFSRATYTLDQLVGAVREGARYAAVLPDPADPARSGDIKLVVHNYFNDVDTSEVQIDVSTLPVDGRVTVSVQNHPFALITPLVNVITKDTLFMSRTATFRWERASK